MKFILLIISAAAIVTGIVLKDHVNISAALVISGVVFIALSLRFWNKNEDNP